MSIKTNAENVAQAVKEGRREARELRKHLTDVTRAVARFVEWIDAEMKQPSTPERGKRVAKAVGALEMANDTALHFGLGVPLAKLKPRKRPGQRRRATAPANNPPNRGGRPR